MVYFMQEGSEVIGKGRIKIGWSQNPLRRLETLQAGNPDQLYLILVTPQRSEKAAHNRFQSYRIGATEWFWPGDELVAAITNSWKDVADYEGWTFDGRVDPQRAEDLCQGWMDYRIREPHRYAQLMINGPWHSRNEVRGG